MATMALAPASLRRFVAATLIDVSHVIAGLTLAAMVLLHVPAAIATISHMLAAVILRITGRERSTVGSVVIFTVLVVLESS